MFEILYRDEHFIAVNKPAGLMTHGGEKLAHGRHNLLQSLNNHFQRRLYVVHRLDKPTSGVILLAFDEQTAGLLATQWQSRDVEKRYIALVRGWAEASLRLDFAMPPPTDRFAKVKKELPAQTCITHFQCLAHLQLDVAVDKYPSARYSLIEAQPETGRKHQIRRHLRHLNQPILRDGRYGKGKHSQYFRDVLGVERMLLHAWQLQIKHPYSGETMRFCAGLDSSFQQLLVHLECFNALPAALQQATLCGEQAQRTFE